MSRTTDKYVKIRKPADTAPENEIRIRAIPQIGRYISYAATLILEKKLDTVLIKASGNAVKSACQIAEILRHRIAGLHQLNNLKTISVIDEYEPREEGLDKVVIERKLAVLEISLSLKETAFDTKAAGYQSPLPAEEVQEEELKNVLEGRRRGGRGSRGGARGGYRGDRDNRGERGDRGYDREERVDRGDRGDRGYDNRGDRGYDNRGERGDRVERRGGRGGRGGYRGDRGDRGYDNRGDRGYDNRGDRGDRGYDNRGDRGYDNRGDRGYDNREERGDREFRGRGRYAGPRGRGGFGGRGRGGRGGDNREPRE